MKKSKLVYRHQIQDGQETLEVETNSACGWLIATWKQMRPISKKVVVIIPPGIFLALLIQWLTNF